MSDFNKLCKEFEEIDVLSYGAMLAAKSVKLIPALSAISEDGLSGLELYATFILGAVASDGKLSEEEYALLYPLLHTFFGDSIDYETARKSVKKLRRESKELLKLIDEMVDVIGQLSEDMKDDIIIVMLLITAIDGKISLREKNWIKKLIK